MRHGTSACTIPLARSLFFQYDYVSVDSVDKGAANPGELAIGRVRKVDDELVEVHWHAKTRASNTFAGVVAHVVAVAGRRRGGRCRQVSRTLRARAAIVAYEGRRLCALRNSE
jgi:hypothetical protein